MGVINDKILVNTSRDHLFDVAQDVEKYPEFLPSVKSVAVLETMDNGHRRSKWDAYAEVVGFRRPIRWTSKDHWDRPGYVARFQQLKGDYKKYGGEWRFTEIEPEITRMELKVDFDLGLPGFLKPLIDPLLDKLMEQNVKSMLSHMKKRAETLYKKGR